MSTSPSNLEDLEDARRQLADRPPEDILAAAAERHGPRIGFATGFGPEGCVLIDLIGRLGLPIRVFTLDTGLLFAETHALWRRLEERYELRIEAVRPPLTVEQQAERLGDRLWEREPDRCCGLRKVEPLRAALRGLDAWVTAIRRDQTADRADAQVLEWDPRFGLIKVNPLASWTAEDVWEHLWTNDVPFNLLHVQGYPSIGCAPCTGPVAPGEDPRAGRWRPFTKKECGLHSRRPGPEPAPGRGEEGRPVS